MIISKRTAPIAKSPCAIDRITRICSGAM